jgi:hypothetical protein
MHNKTDIREALKQTWAWENNSPIPNNSSSKGQDKEVSLLIHDIFGAEILKTPNKKGWHFYNRIDGERIDFSNAEAEKQSAESLFEDIPSTPEETGMYFEPVDYSSFYTKFIRAFEEIIGRGYYRQGYSA